LKIEAVPETKQLVVECLSSLSEGAVTQDLRDIVLQAASEAWGNLATLRTSRREHVPVRGAEAILV
jgi:hypothetical protein